MREVTPVEALDVKLCCLQSAKTIGLRAATLGDSAWARGAVSTARLLQSAIPVAWNATTFQAVLAAAATYPHDAWPVVPDRPELRLHVFPGEIHDGATLMLVGFAPFNGERVFVVRAMRYIEELRLWDGASGFNLPALASIEELRHSFGLHGTDSRISPETAKKLMSLAFAAWAFLDQRIAVEERAGVERHARRRAERLDIDPTVHVVRLRKAEVRSHSNDDPRDVEWSCRWLVRGHWRNQWHQRLQRHAPVWITPHIKGPADMPLKTPAPEVWQVAR